MTKFLRQIGRLLGGHRIARDLAEEIETHRAMLQERFEKSGMSPAEAARASRRAIGNVTLSREDARAVWVPPTLDSVWQDVRYAGRMLRRAPAFSTAAILVLALGIGATTAAFGLLDALVLQSLPVHQPGRLVWFRSPSFSYPIYSEVRGRSSHVFSGLFAWNVERLNVQWGDTLEPTDVLTASGDFHSTLGIAAAAGRTFTDEDDRAGGGPEGPVAVISHACWQRRFAGDPAVIGRTIRIDRRPFTIVGVTPRGFFGVAPGMAPEITIPLTSLQTAEALREPHTSWIHMMGRLRDGLTLEGANAAVHSLWPAVLEATTNPGMPADRRRIYLGRTTGLESARAGFSRVRNQFGDSAWMLLGLSALLLAVACASAANLFLARGLARRREIAVRLAIGADRWRLVRQMLTEALVWTLLGSALGLVFATWSGGGLVALMSTWEDPIAIDVVPNGRVLTFVSALALLTAVLCAVYPALRATDLPPGPTLKDSVPARSAVLRGWSFGKTLVAAQVALTVLLLVGAALFLRSLDRILSRDAGFDLARVVVVATDAAGTGYAGERLLAFYSDLLSRLRSMPGVEAAGLSKYAPISDQDGSWTQSIAVDGVPQQPDSHRTVYFNAVSPEYFRTLGIPLLRGRDLTDGDREGAPRTVVVNESLARRVFAAADPLGRRISIGRDASRQDLWIVGIVGDARYQRLQEPARPIAYLPYAQVADLRRGANLYAAVRAAGPLAPVADGVRRTVRALDPNVPVRIQTVMDRVRESVVRERAIAILGAALGISALALACASLYGLLAYAVSQHTNEIGLRLALGADRASVLWMVLRQCLALASAGSLIGAGASLALGRFVRSQLFEISATDALSVAVACAIMVAVAVIAGWLPARRAARLDPVAALRVD